MARKPMAFNWIPNTTDAELARINNCSQTTVMNWRKRNGVEQYVEEDVNRMELSDKEKKYLWRQLHTKYKAKVATYAYNLSLHWKTHSKESIIEDIYLEVFIITQKYFQHSQYTLDEYISMAINWACKSLKAKWGETPFQLDYDNLAATDILGNDWRQDKVLESKKEGGNE